MPTNSFLEKYPNLFREVVWPWGPTRATFILFDSPPAKEKISNINIVPRLAENWVSIRLKDGTQEIPGGTLEPNESYLDAIRRELLEEAGAQLISFKIIGGWHCFSLADKPFRPHLTHPEFYRVVGVGEIKIIKRPENPPDGEVVELVEVASMEATMNRFLSIGRPDLSELYQLAFELN